jgi:hypothetical protein
MSGISGCCDDVSSYEGLIVEFQPTLKATRIEVETDEVSGSVSLADPFHMCPKWCWHIFGGYGEVIIGRPDESHLAFAEVDVDVTFAPRTLTLTVFDGDTVVGMETFHGGDYGTHDCGGPPQTRVTMKLRDP